MRSPSAVQLSSMRPATAVLRTDTEGEVLLAADACWVSRSYRSLRMPFPLARLVMDDPAAFRRSLEQLP